MERKGRWIEVLKKMMHHHTFTLFPISGGCEEVKGERESERVSSVRFYMLICMCMEVWDANIVCVRTCKNADTTFK